MVRYDAFISYSHLKDKPIAAALQSAMQRLGKNWYQRRALRIFRDDTSLSATPHLWPSIESALSESRFLILLASPHAAASPWVDKELTYWLEHRGADTLLIGLTEGALGWDAAAGEFTPGAPLPPAVKGRLNGEPKWVDLTAYRAGAAKSDAKFTELAADFAAAIRGMPKEDLLSQEVLQQRRALILAWSAAASLLFLAALAGWQWTVAVSNEQLAKEQERIAKTERDRAERTLTAATKTANSLVFDLAVRFEDKLGLSATLVKDILDRAQRLQRELTEADGATPELKRSAAMASDKSAHTLLAIGESDAALASAQRASGIFEQLVNSDPINVELQHGLSISYNTLGSVLLQQRKLEDALAQHRKSLQLIKRVAGGMDRGKRNWQRDLAVTYNDIGNVLLQLGRTTEAERSFRESIAIFEQLGAAEPENTLWQSDLALTYARIADLYKADGNIDEALSIYQKSIAVRERLIASDGTNAAWQRGLALIYVMVGDLLLEDKKVEDALTNYRRSLELADRLARSDRSNGDLQHSLWMAHLRIGDALEELAKSDEALSSFELAQKTLEPLAASDRSNALWQNDLIVTYLRIGALLKWQGKSEAGLTRYRRALAVVESLISSDSTNRNWQWLLLVCNWKLASAGENTSHRLRFITAELSKLRDRNELTSDMAEMLSAAEEQLAKLRPSVSSRTGQ
jgi:tetratricopeptide (TPR) repeat protein